MLIEMVTALNSYKQLEVTMADFLCKFWYLSENVEYIYTVSLLSSLEKYEKQFEELFQV